MIFILLDVIVALINVVSELAGGSDSADDVFHMVGLASDEASEVEDNALCLVSLPGELAIGMLKSCNLLAISGTLLLEVFGDTLLQDESLESVVSLSLDARKSEGETSGIVLLLIDETSESAVLALVRLDLDTKLGKLLVERLDKCLELLELQLPGLDLLLEIVVALGHLLQFCIHASLEIDEILPGFESIARVLIAFTDKLVHVSHGDLGHQGLFGRTTKDSLDASVATKLLTDVIHDGHGRILVPPGWVLDRLDLAAQNDDLTSRDELTTSIRRLEMLRYTSEFDIMVEGLSQTCDHLLALLMRQNVGRVVGNDQVAVKVNQESILGRLEERAAFSSDTKNVWAGLLNHLTDIASMNHRDVETTPLVNAHAESDGLGGDGQHGRMVTGENDTASRRDSSFHDSNDVGHGKTAEEWPHGEVLEAGGRGRKLVAQSIILHVDADKIVEAGCREAQDARDLFGVEEVSGLVPVNPHSTEVVTEEVVEGISGQETQAIRDPVCLVSNISVVWLCLSAQFADGLCALLIGSGPDTEGDAVESMLRVLLKDERMMDAMRLAATGADFDIVREASLKFELVMNATKSRYDLPSLHCEELWRSRYQIRDEDCSQGSQEARTGQQHLSCAESCRVREQVP